MPKVGGRHEALSATLDMEGGDARPDEQDRYFYREFL